VCGSKVNENMKKVESPKLEQLDSADLFQSIRKNDKPYIDMKKIKERN